MNLHELSAVDGAFRAVVLGRGHQSEWSLKEVVIALDVQQLVRKARKACDSLNFCKCQSVILPVGFRLAPYQPKLGPKPACLPVASRFIIRAAPNPTYIPSQAPET